MDLSFYYSFVLFVFSARDCYDYLEDDDEMEYER